MAAKMQLLTLSILFCRHVQLLSISMVAFRVGSWHNEIDFKCSYKGKIHLKVEINCKLQEVTKLVNDVVPVHCRSSLS